MHFKKEWVKTHNVCEEFLHMYIQYACPFSSITSFYVSAGLARLHSDTETTAKTLPRPDGQSQTRPQA